MINSTTRKLSRFQFAATLLGALAISALAPTATAFATNDEDISGPGGCHFTQPNGDEIPITDGADVFVDGKIVSCRAGKIIITVAPKTGASNAQQQQLPQGGAVLSPANETPKKAPVVRNVPVGSARN